MQTLRVMRAKESLIGCDVKSEKGQDLGDVKELLIDRHTGEVVFAVVKFDDAAELSGRTALGEEMMAAMPWETLTMRVDDKGEPTFISKASVQKIEGQMFSSKKWPDIVEPNWSVTVYRHYGLQPYWQSGDRETDVELRRERGNREQQK
jgi:sporulation protein YlmC with PRC-barrel domain